MSKKEKNIARAKIDPVRDFRPELTPESSILSNWSGVNFRLKDGKVITMADNVNDAILTQTMEGASSLVIHFSDPDDALLNSGLFDRAFDFPLSIRTVDGDEDVVWYRYVGISCQGGVLSATFEDRDVKYLRYHKKPLHASRADHTRAEFLLMLVRKVRAQSNYGRGIAVVCPQLHRRQDIEAKDDKKTKKNRDRNRRPGLSTNDDVYVKGTLATAEQIGYMNEVLDVGMDMGADEKVLLTALIVVTQESGWDPNIRDYDTGTHVGLFQQDSKKNSYWYKLGGGRIGKRHIKAQARVFFKTALTAIKNNPDMDEVALAESVQGINYRDSPGRWLDEAKDILEAYGTGRVREQTYYKSFIFSTVNDGEPEDYWTAMRRLADEVQWALFMSNGALYFMSETDLYNSPTRWSFNRTTPGVVDVSFSYDEGQAASTMQVVVNADIGVFPVGCCVRAKDLGPMSGKWIVSEWTRSLFRDQATITLKKPTKPLPEPRPEEVTVQYSGSTSQPDPNMPGGPTTDNLKDVTPRGSYSGTRSIFTQYVFPFMDARGLKPGSQKRARVTTSSGGVSDHYEGNNSAYATDFPTFHGEGIARALAKSIGWHDWKPNAYGNFNTKINGRTYRWQIIWGAEVGHGDHIHVGVKRID